MEQTACPPAQLLRIPCYAVKLQSYQACGGTPRYPAAMLHISFLPAHAHDMAMREHILFAMML